MELNKEILSGLSLINSSFLDKEALKSIFDQCNKTISSSVGSNGTSNHCQTATDEKTILKNVVTFSVHSLLMEAAKYNVNESTVITLLQENNLDTSTDNFKLFANFLHTTLGKARHNLERMTLVPGEKFQDLEWSQIFDLKSSSIDCIKEKNYMLDIHTQAGNANEDRVFSLALSHKELQDMHATLRDCVKNVENFINKTE